MSLPSKSDITVVQAPTAAGRSMLQFENSVAGLRGYIAYFGVSAGPPYADHIVHWAPGGWSLQNLFGDALVMNGSSGNFNIGPSFTDAGIKLAIQAESASAGIQLGSGDTLAVAPVDTGRFRFNVGTETMQLSNSTGAWVDIATGAGGGMAIGGAIAGATAGSVLFAGVAGILQQDNAHLFWDDPNNRLGLGTAVPLFPFDVRAASAGGSQVHISDSLDDGGYLASTQPSSLLIMGGMSFNGTAFIAKATEATIVALENGRVDIGLDNGLTPGVALAPGPTVRFQLLTDGGMVFKNSNGAALSAAGEARFRYNSGTNKLELSENGGAYANVV